MTTLAGSGPRGYLAIIADIRGSRRLPDRQAVQDRLRTTLADLEQRFAADLAAGFAITTGDEFQVLLHDPAAGVPVVVACDEALTGLPLRFGLGWGPLATRLEARAVGMDGPCFHAARAAIDHAAAEDRWLAVRGLDPTAEAALDGIFALLGAIRAGWTTKQAEAVARRRLVATQRALAAELDLDPSTVSKRLKSALFDEVVAAEQAAAILLSRFTAPSDSPEAPA
jgi:hypothetical protein